VNDSSEAEGECESSVFHLIALFLVSVHSFLGLFQFYK